MGVLHSKRGPKPSLCKFPAAESQVETSLTTSTRRQRTDSDRP